MNKLILAACYDKEINAEQVVNGRAASKSSQFGFCSLLRARTTFDSIHFNIIFFNNKILIIYI